MVSKKFGETKGPFIVWVFVICYFALLIIPSSSSNGTLPQNLNVPIILGLLFGIIQPFGAILVFLVVFLFFWEKQRSLKAIFSSVGLKRKGSVQSVLWTFALIPLFFIIYLLLMLLSYFLGPVSFPQASAPDGVRAPLWYLYYMMLYSFFPVSVVEEILARGYMLDRFMPQHPSSIVKALPAILLSSLLFTLYHVPAYLKVYPFSLSWAIALLIGNVFPMSVVLSIAYVRARTRNIIGPVLMHFLADSMPIILSLALG